MKGVTPDQRVINATKRQPEYGKPVGDYVNAIASNRRVADAQLKAREWAKTFDEVEKKFGVERWVLLALWGMESDFGTEKDRWDVFRSLATLGYIKYPRPLFPQRTARGDADHAEQPSPTREDGELMGRRHGADPIHADELRRLRHRFLW
jgi:membrane-bound lytic murein transglycosylase B